MVAGKITPAIATTTAAIVGLVSLQIYTLNQKDDIKYLRDCNINFAFNNYTFISPVQVEHFKNDENSKEIKYIPDNFTIWDFLEVKKSMLIKEFIENIFKKYQININSISCNNWNLYESNSNVKFYDDKIEDAFNRISNYKLNDSKKFLVLDILGKLGDIPAKMPKIKYIFKE